MRLYTQYFVPKESILFITNIFLIYKSLWINEKSVNVNVIKTYYIIIIIIIS